MKKDAFVRIGSFFPMISISVVIKQALFTLSCFSEPKLAKTVLILIKENLRFTLNLSVVPYFEKILCSVTRGFIGEIILHRHLQILFYNIVIVVATVT